jgi:hypothetical protein
MCCTVMLDMPVGPFLGLWHDAGKKEILLFFAGTREELLPRDSEGTGD